MIPVVSEALIEMTSTIWKMKNTKIYYLIS